MNEVITAEEATRMRALLLRAKAENVLGGDATISMRSGPYVYIYHDPEDGKPFYVGKGSRKRCFDLFNRSTYFLNKLRQMCRHGRAPSITVAFVSSHECAMQLEAALVEAYGRRDIGTGPLVNLTAGGIGISSPSTETREKIAASKRGKARSLETITKIIETKRGKPLSPELLLKIRAAAARRIGTKMPRTAVEKTRAWHLGRKRPAITVERIRLSRLGSVLSPEHRAAISAANTGKTLSVTHRANLSAARMGKFTGRSPSAETRAKMSAAHRGRRHSAESIEKMRAAKLGVKKSPEARARMSIAKKAMWAARRAATQSMAAAAEVRENVQ